MDTRQKRRAHTTAADVDHDDHNDHVGHDHRRHVVRGRRGHGDGKLGCGTTGPAAPRAARLSGQVQPPADRPAWRLLGALQLRAGSAVVPVRRVHHVHYARRLHVPRQSGTALRQVNCGFNPTTNVVQSFWFV